MYPVNSTVFVEGENHYLSHYYIVGDVYHAHVELITGQNKLSANGVGDNHQLATQDAIRKIKDK